ncbi:MAG: WGR domain-containing protein [Roseovarius sp.]|nr:WGR domain-containing protein [Roseovarius sp.]
MGNTAIDTTLYRIDHTRNMSRFYTLTIQPNLFGGYSLMRNWGRIGTGGRMRIEFFDCPAASQDECDRLLHSKQQRGYCVKG